MKGSTQVFNPMLQKVLLFAVTADWNLQPRRLWESGYSCFVQSPKPRSSAGPVGGPRNKIAIAGQRPCRYHSWLTSYNCNLTDPWTASKWKQWVCFGLAASCRVCGTCVSQVSLPHFQADRLRKWLQDSHSFAPFFPAGVLCPLKEQMRFLALKRLLIGQKPLSEL